MHLSADVTNDSPDSPMDSLWTEDPEAYLKPDAFQQVTCRVTRRRHNASCADYLLAPEAL